MLLVTMGGRGYNKQYLIGRISMTDFKIDTTQYNQVNYFGLILSVPKQYEYIATDYSGNLYAYEKEPESGDDSFWSTSPSEKIFYITDNTDDWKQSLKK